jgi:hypothetical protein
LAITFEATNGESSQNKSRERQSLFSDHPEQQLPNAQLCTLDVLPLSQFTLEISLLIASLFTLIARHFLFLKLNMKERKAASILEEADNLMMRVSANN